MGLDQDVVKIYENDPVAGQDACKRLSVLDAHKVANALVNNDFAHNDTHQTSIRLKNLSSSLGPKVASIFKESLIHGGWHQSGAAAACFAGFKSSNELDRPLIEILKKNEESMDCLRRTIEALGFLKSGNWSYFLQDLAYTGEWITDRSQVAGNYDRYYFGKLSSYVIEALVRFAGSATTPDNRRYILEQLRDLTQIYEEMEPSRSRYGSIIRAVDHELSPACVDGLIHCYNQSSSVSWREITCDVLQEARSVRSVRFLLGTIGEYSEIGHQRRVSASIALGELRDKHVASLVAEYIRQKGAGYGYLDWAYSSLRMVPIDWSGTEGFAERILSSEEDNEIRCQLLYSLALAGECQYESQFVSMLDSKHSFVRWTAALGLARSMKEGSLDYIEGRHEEAGDTLEKCGMIAAVVHAGDHSKIPELHQELQNLRTLPILRSIWRVAFVSPFRVYSPFDQRAFGLWWSAARLKEEQIRLFRYDLAPLSGESVGLTHQSLQSPVMRSYKTYKEPETMISLLEASQVATVAGHAVSIIDKIYTQYVSFKSRKNATDAPSITAEIADDKENNKITLSENGKSVQSISYAELSEKLNEADIKYIVAKDLALRNHYQIWLIVYPQLSLSVDPIAKAKIELSLSQISSEMGKELADIIDFLERIGLQLDGHYDAIRQIARK
ncbi:hypothetical protein [Methylobacterium sp. SyP6R]|uniref:hypothetical protein n=1 Tax=Methylobacterium sp. SyP6R TaxID=2718876 RepID=UPI001F456202|nr:hypothetical protein [Methylobacterium sp. SyP6R]MCF4129680.1 hypothetical protein [Methylobacterium sp. SyP6R]